MFDFFEEEKMTPELIIGSPVKGEDSSSFQCK